MVARDPVKVAAGRIGGLTKAGRYDPRTLTSPAREGFLRRFLTEVDAASPGLPEPERQRRAQALLKAHMCRLAMASVRARQKGGDGRA